MPRTARRFLGRTGHFVLVTAMAATVTAVINQPQSASAADPVNVITSPPLVGSGGTPGGFTVNDLGSGTITVTNPGSTAATTQTCAPKTAKDFCLGTSDDGSDIEISGYATQPKGLPGEAMDFLVDDAVAAVAAEHGVKADDAVRSYARPEIRAHVIGRIQSILNKKLYGQTLLPEEEKVYASIEDWYKQKQVAAASNALYEYQLWSANPCTYVAPAPPAGSGLPVVPNEARQSSDCAPNAPSKLFKFSNNTPPASTFDTWASYKNPTASMTNASNAEFQRMTVATVSGIVLAAGTAGAVAGGFAAVAGTTLAASITAANIAWAAALEGITVTTSSVLSSWLGALGVTAAAFVGAVASVLIGIVIGAVAIYQLIEDAKPGKELAERVTNAPKLTDTLGIESRIADYAGLNMAISEDPADKPKAAIHEAGFSQQIVAQVNEWLMFTEGGTLIPDPVGSLVGGAVPGFPAEPTAGDFKFKEEGGLVQDYIQLLAAPNAVGRDGTTPINGYRVKISRGWLMVAEVKPGGVVGPYLPRLSVDYLAPDGSKGLMSIVQHGAAGTEPKIDIQLTKPETVGGNQKVVGTLAPSWSFKNTASTTRTMTLQTVQPVLPQVNVVPSVQGDMVADHNITLNANASSPADTATDKQYTWVLQRLAANGTVAETIPPPAGNLTGFQHRFTTPGLYRAKVTLTGNNPGAFTAGGRVEFTIREPEPEVITATVRDSRELGGSLSLDLRLLQNTRPNATADDFTVKVDWASDGDGTPVSETYQVQCFDTGFDTCDTGPLSEGPPEFPTNANWSKSPTFFIPPTQNYLPFVNVTITNSYGQVIERAFPITPGDQRPKYLSDIPTVELPAGVSDTDYTVDVVQVTPSTLPVDADPDLTIQPYFGQIVDQLPDGLRPDLVKKPNGEWWLQIKGSTAFDSIGTYPFYFPFEQEPIGSGLRPPPALVNLEVKAAVAPGYRAILRGVPAAFTDRSYRNVYPDYKVQVAQVRTDGGTSFTPFTGTVKCKLVSGPQIVFDKPCAQDKTFPWPAERITDGGGMKATVYVESASQQISADGPYEAALMTRFLNPIVTTTTPATNALKQNFALRLDDNGPVNAPFAGYTVTCSFDKTAYKPCFTDGTTTLLRVPGTHTIDVRAIKSAPSAATTNYRYTWTVPTPKKTLGLKLPVTSIKRGKSMTVKGSLLLPRESYKIRIGGITVATGRCTDLGTISRRVKVPARLKPGRYKVVLIGANGTRTTYRWLRVKR